MDRGCLGLRQRSCKGNEFGEVHCLGGLIEFVELIELVESVELVELIALIGSRFVVGNGVGGANSRFCFQIWV